jgi:hypothetical protein
MALFGRSPAERERKRLHVLEGRAGMAARNALVQRDRGRYVEPEHDPPLRNPWRPTPERPTPPRPMRMFVARPERPWMEMTDEEIDAFAHEMVEGMAEQRVKAKAEDAERYG